LVGIIINLDKLKFLDTNWIVLYHGLIGRREYQCLPQPWQCKLEVHLLHLQQWEKQQWLDDLSKRCGRKRILVHGYRTATLRLSPPSLSTQSLSLTAGTKSLISLCIFCLGFLFASWVNSSLLLMCWFVLLFSFKIL
jgi:hypothetical protein